MNRRRFLSFLGVAPVAAVAAPLPVGPFRQWKEGMSPAAVNASARQALIAASRYLDGDLTFNLPDYRSRLRYRLKL